MPTVVFKPCHWYSCLSRCGAQDSVYHIMRHGLMTVMLVTEPFHHSEDLCGYDYLLAFKEQLVRFEVVTG